MTDRYRNNRSDERHSSYRDYNRDSYRDERSSSRRSYEDSPERSRQRRSVSSDRVSSARPRQSERRTTSNGRSHTVQRTPDRRRQSSAQRDRVRYQQQQKRPIPIIPIAIIIAVLLVIILAVRGCGGCSSQDTQNAVAPVNMAETSADTSATASPSSGANGASSKNMADVDPAIILSGAQATAKLCREARLGDYSVSIATTGDIMFAREVSNFVDENGGAAALANVAAPLAAADVTFANLECPLTYDESEALYGKDVLWRSNPKGIDALTTAGIDCVSLANNHIMDYGSVGLKDTLDALDGAGIKHAGAGMTEREAGEYAELTVDGLSIAFFSWTDIIPDNFIAFDDYAGVVSARLNMDDACKRVSEAKKTHDVVVVAMHWGIEYQDYIDSGQQEVPAHELVDAGADVVWGNHPHVFQGIEFYNGSLISYSQGDFVCDHYSQKTGESFILSFSLTPDGIKNVTATPVYLDDTYGIPSIVTGEEAQNILGRLEEISDGMNSNFEIADDIAYISPIQEM